MGMSLGTMCRLFLFQMLLTMLLALPITSAHAQYGGGYGQQSQAQVFKAQLNMRTRGYTEIAVKKEIKLATGVQLKGMKLVKVIMKASSMRGNAKAQLMINGMRVGYPQNISTYMEKIVFDLPMSGRKVIGHDIKSIKIVVQGKVHTKMVGLKVKRAQMSGSHGRVVTVNTHKRVRGSQRISLSQLVGYHRALEGKMVKEITIQAQGQGSIIAVARGSQLGSVTVGRRAGVRTIKIYGQMQAQDIKLRMTGNMTITCVQVKVKGQSQGGYGQAW